MPRPKLDPSERTTERGKVKATDLEWEEILEGAGLAEQGPFVFVREAALEKARRLKRRK